MLDIAHKELNFPSSSTAYRLLQSSRKFIKSAVTTAQESFVHNIVLSSSQPKYGYMLKIEERYLEAKAKWNPRDNSSALNTVGISIYPLVVSNMLSCWYRTVSFAFRWRIIL